MTTTTKATSKITMGPKQSTLQAGTHVPGKGAATLRTAQGRRGAGYAGTMHSQQPKTFLHFILDLGKLHSHVVYTSSKTGPGETGGTRLIGKGHRGSLYYVLCIRVTPSGNWGFL